MRLISTLSALTLLLLSCIVLPSCKKEDEPTLLNVNPTSISLESDAYSNATVYLTCNDKWSVTSKPDWVTVSSTSGEKNASLTISANSKNTTEAPRKGRVEFKAGGVTATLDVSQAVDMRLEVNPSSVSLVSTANSTAVVNIVCSTDWTVTSKPDWVNISSTSGKGNTTMTITALSDNSTASVRTGRMEIKSANNTATVEISQVASLESGCEVIISDEVILNTSATFRLNFGSKASWMYGGYFPASSAGWSDDKIISELVNNHDAMNVKADMYLTDYDLDPSTTYIQCFVSYTDEGKRGEVIRHKFTTPSSKDAPIASIEEVKYSSDYWYWVTKIGGIADEYYTVYWTGDDAYYVRYSWAPSTIGMFFKEMLKENNLISFRNNEEWKEPRKPDDDRIFIATWAQRDKTWSPVITRYYGWINSDSKASGAALTGITDNEQTAKPGCIPLYAADRERLLKNIHIVR